MSTSAKPIGRCDTEAGAKFTPIVCRAVTNAGNLGRCGTVGFFVPVGKVAWKFLARENFDFGGDSLFSSYSR